MGDLVDNMSRETGVTALPAPLTGGLDLTTLPDRLDDRTLAAVREIADAALPSLPACDDKHFAKCLRAMLAVLPRQQADEVTGELFVRTYQRQLGSYPDAAISFLAQRATLHHQWFPTIRQCLDILAGWQRSDEAAGHQMLARAAYRREMQARLDDAMDAMRDGAISQPQIDALPEYWKRIAVERGLLRLHGDGTYALRRKPPAGSKEVPVEPDPSLVDAPAGVKLSDMGITLAKSSGEKAKAA